jgi:AbrB family looped-hinge helix DNA binding protein
MNHYQPQSNGFNCGLMVKVGASRQVAIPKRVCDQLRLQRGDYLEVQVKNAQLVLTPRVFIEKRLAEGLRDLKAGRGIGPFSTAKESMKALLE